MFNRKLFLVTSALLTALIGASAMAMMASSTFRTKGGYVATIEQVTAKDLRAEEAVFHDAFESSYRKLPAIMECILKKYPNLETFLIKAFEDEITDFANKKDGAYFLHAVIDGRIVAYMSFDAKDQEAYIRALAVDPHCMGMGLGKELTQTIYSIRPDIRKIELVTRRANTPAINFYKRLGFVESNYVHEGLDPLLYIGMELNRKR